MELDQLLALQAVQGSNNALHVWSLYKLFKARKNVSLDAHLWQIVMAPRKP
jgi:hypothetical protein